MNGTKLRGFILAAALVSTYPVLTLCHAAQTTDDNKVATQGGEDAATLFAKNCATCHGKDGHAKTFKAKFNHARDLADGRWQADVTDERLFNSISNGKGKMPAFGKKFSEAEINALVAYVRQLKQ